MDRAPAKVPSPGLSGTSSALNCSSALLGFTSFSYSLESQESH